MLNSQYYSMARKKHSRTQPSVGFRCICSLISVIGKVLLYLNNLELEQPRVRHSPSVWVVGWGDQVG